MKKVLVVVAVMLFAASFVLAQDHLAQHNYTANGIQQGCRGCHIPHGGSVATNMYPGRVTVFGSGADDYSTGTFYLWDKNIAVTSYNVYSSSNPDLPSGRQLGYTADSTDPVWHSYLCFSCHDGAVAGMNLPPAIVANLTQSGDFLMNSGNGDTDLTNDHPVDIIWPITGQAGRYETVAHVTGGNAGCVGCTTQALPLYGTSNKMECATCHNPHIQPATANGNRGNFLRIDTVADNTGFCRTCHLDKR